MHCIFTWYWVADFCAEQGINFTLGHSYYMKSINGGKTKSAEMLRMMHYHSQQKKLSRFTNLFFLSIL